jgi:2-polyprenyl-6-hydroxyphenyl methylase/3-demethylubiquinone-9 3-methyltransferase
MTDVRFGFGRNWSEFSKQVVEADVSLAVDGMNKLLPASFSASGKSFLDIGSGSGLHSVAASRIGFGPIVATDYDPDSTATTRNNAARFGANIAARQDDILNSNLDGSFDVVYSWGVLHHTGNMAKAIANAASLVAPGGLFIIAIYYRTPFCGMWTAIKRTYCQSPAWLQKAMVNLYYALVVAKRFVTGQAMSSYDERGMDRYYDVIDWMGGYPYESADAGEVEKMVGPGFSLLKSFGTQRRLGLFGTACAEYVFRRSAAA